MLTNEVVGICECTLFIWLRFDLGVVLIGEGMIVDCFACS